MNVSTFLTPHLRELETELRTTLPRLSKREDKEAVHDFRVVLRRLRSLLRPARRVYGKFHTDAVRAALKGVADASGGLRDEEVLEETLAAIELTSLPRAEVTAWIVRRKRRLQVLRASLLRLVREGGVERALKMLDALLSLPVPPKEDREADHFARKVVSAAQRDVEHARETPLDDVTGLHALRILYKRLRYAVDGFLGVLTPQMAAIAPSATKFQKRLGDVHDVDVALMVIARARGLSLETRTLVTTALQARRSKVIAKYVTERDAPATGDPPPPAPPKETTRTRAARRAAPTRIPRRTRRDAR